MLGPASTGLSAGSASSAVGSRIDSAGADAALFIVGATLATFAMALACTASAGSSPISRRSERAPPPSPARARLSVLGLTLAYAVFRADVRRGTAIYMDVRRPRFAATSSPLHGLCNLVYSYTSTWQGRALEHWGYPTTLTLDALFGLIRSCSCPSWNGCAGNRLHVDRFTRDARAWPLPGLVEVPS